MAAKQAVSHLQVGEGVAKLERIVVAVGGREHLDPEYIPDWDFSMDVGVMADVTLDLDRGLAIVGLTSDSALALSLVWHATGSGLRGASQQVIAGAGDNTVSLNLPGGVLGGQLAIEIVLSLAAEAREAPPLSPRRAGSILWSARRAVRLEGDGSRFPISSVSFKDSGIAEGLPAAWTLLFESSELYDSGLGNVRLYLNSDHPAAAALMSSVGGDAEVVTKVLHGDINRVLVLQALSTDGLDLGEDYPTESMGELLSLAIQRNFPGQAIEEVDALRRSRPGEFEGFIQARGGFLL